MRRLLPLLLLGSMGACFDPPPEVTDELDAVTQDTAPEGMEDIAPETETGPACVTDCGAQGVCDETTGACDCDAGWSGPTCSTCDPDHFGPSCQACDCEQGVCDAGLEGTGACDCDEGWAGTSCDASLAVPWETEFYSSQDWATAGDVTFASTEGSFSLAETWTGLDSFLFFFHYPASAESAAIWEGQPDELFASLPPNVHVIFGSFGDDHEVDVASMEGRVKLALDAMSAQARDHWSSRVHFVDGKVSDLEGVLDDRIDASSSYKFAIDRYQRWRSLGALYDMSIGSWSLGYLGYEPWVFNGEHHARTAALRTGGLEIPIMAPTVLAAGEVSQVEAELPSPEQMAVFDALQVAVHVHCVDDDEGPGGGCGESPGTVQLFVCDGESACDMELARVMTPYGRAGSFLTDADPLVPLLDGGGLVPFEVRAAQAVRIEISLVLYDAGHGDRATTVIPLWDHGSGADFDADYCTTQPAYDLETPPGASRVELVTRITGHGESATIDACAALCDHAHHFHVGDEKFSVSHPDAGVSGACLDLTGGVIPNQFGDWTLGRAGWCPGSATDLSRHDVTAALGLAQSLGYSAERDGEPYEAWIVDPSGSMPSITMTSWLVAFTPRTEDD